MRQFKVIHGYGDDTGMVAEMVDAGEGWVDLLHSTWSSPRTYYFGSPHREDEVVELGASSMPETLIINGVRYTKEAA